MGFKIKDFSMKTFNSDVNHSGNLDDKYKQWSMYRKSITDKLDSIISDQSKLESAIFFACGECNDLNLDYLLKKFGHIVLTDVDEKSIYEGIKRQKISDEDIKRIDVVQMEYTGLSESKFFEKLAEQVSQGHKIGKIIDHIKDLSVKAFNPNGFDKYRGKFDFAMSCPVYTQLVYTQMEVLFKIIRQFDVYSDNDVDRINQAVSRVIPHIIKSYNDLTLSVLKPEGNIVMLTDVVEISSDNEMIPQIKRRLSKTDVDNSELFEFVESYGLKFGKKGYKDIVSKIQKEDYHFALWPFDEYKQYLVLMVNGVKVLI